MGDTLSANSLLGDVNMEEPFTYPQTNTLSDCAALSDQSTFPPPAELFGDPFLPLTEDFQPLSPDSLESLSDLDNFSPSSYSDSSFSDSSPSHYSPSLGMDMTGPLTKAAPAKAARGNTKAAVTKKRKAPAAKRSAEPRKKRAKASAEDADIRSELIALRSEKLTVSELEKKVSALKQQSGALNSAEQEEVKKLKRMIKNRESALASRLRKSKLIDDMKDEIARITEENERLQGQVAHLQADNDSLRSQLEEARGHNPSSSLTASASDLFQGASEFLTQGSFWSIGESKPTPKDKNSNRTSTSLFIVLLTFGLLFAQLSPSMANSGAAAKTLSALHLSTPTHDNQAVAHALSSPVSVPSSQSNSWTWLPGGPSDMSTGLIKEPSVPIHQRSLLMYDMEKSTDLMPTPDTHVAVNRTMPQSDPTSMQGVTAPLSDYSLHSHVDVPVPAAVHKNKNDQIFCL